MALSETIPIQPGNWDHLMEYLSSGFLSVGLGGFTAAKITSPTYGDAVRVGNYADPNPFGTAGKGSPTDAYAPFVVDQNFGAASPNSNVLKTTQAFFAYARYYGPTTDDSAEAGSAVAVLVDTGTPYTTAQPLVGLEGIALVQGGNVSTSKVIGTIGSALLQGTGTVTNVMSLYASTLSGVSNASGTITNYYGVYQDTPQTVGTITNLWGGYFKHDLQVEKRLLVGLVGAQTNSAQTFLNGPNVTGGATDVPSVIAQQGAGATAATIQLRTSAGAARLSMFGSTGNVQLGNGATGGSGVGIVSMVTTTAPSGTPPAAGAYLYVDPADNKLKAKTSGGTVTILTPTA